MGVLKKKNHTTHVNQNVTLETKITIKKINLLAIKLVLKGLNSRVKKETS